MAYFRINLVKSTALVAVTAKVGSSGVSVIGITDAGSRVTLGTISSSYSLTNIAISSTSVFSAIQLEFSSSFSVFEMAGRSDPCWEFATLDLGSAKAISALRVRHYAGNSNSLVKTRYDYSLDGMIWTNIRSNLPGSLVTALDTEIYPAVSARYVRVRHDIQEGAALKVFIWEIKVWGSSGRYGAPLPVSVNPVSFRDLLGVNGIWAWGGQGWSMLAREGWGPKRISNLASHARNYHNWNWDVTDPDNIPNFEGMTCGNGTDSQWWLDWDWEYSGWNAAGLEVEVSIQFTASMFNQNSFNDPYMAAYNYGYAFAKHFGMTYGTGLVATLEVGNEPWDYKGTAFYSKILSGMSRGVKDADPRMRVLPASFANANATLTRIQPSHLQYLDGLNVHAYSWMQTLLGRSGVHPEHNMSTIHDVNWLIRFRNDNAPNLPVYLTEWGWDSAGGGETCGPPTGASGPDPFPECVSEKAQALYAVRGALILARKGLSRLTWYFYANTVETLSSWQSYTGVFARSGLTSSSAAGFVDKLSKFALEQFVDTVGDSHFVGVIREDREAFVYLLGDGNGTVSHVVAWRPVDSKDNKVSSEEWVCNFFPLKIIQLSAFTQYAFNSISKIRSINSIWKVNITNTPLIIQVSSDINFKLPVTKSPLASPTLSPIVFPSTSPSKSPKVAPSTQPTSSPSIVPSKSPTFALSKKPTTIPTLFPSKSPTVSPSKKPIIPPSLSPSKSPTVSPSKKPIIPPTILPSKSPTLTPSIKPSISPSKSPTFTSTKKPSMVPSTTKKPSMVPSKIL